LIIQEKAMQRIMLKSKIHRATVTDSNLQYDGSLTVDADLLRCVDILSYEQIKIYNVSNGERFDTYAIAGLAGSGEICLNGAAARKGAKGDLLIIASYANFDDTELTQHEPKIVLLDSNNRPRPGLLRVIAD
jgi:aspartate 1-decarboxylase